MAALVTCPSCRRSGRVPEKMLTRQIRCTGCGGSFSAGRPVVHAAGPTPAGVGPALNPEQDTPRTPPPLPTSVGRFEVKRFLGEGAFGRVYEGFDPQLRRRVALKVAKPERLNSPDRVARFLGEAHAAAILRHPNIVPVYDAGSDGGNYFIATAFIEGRTLGSLIDETEDGPPLPPRAAAWVVRKLAEALHAAHTQGIIHRDVKPSNVMIDEHGEPLLLDFGLAARLESDSRQTAEGSVMGTPAYMAPEQAAGKIADIGPAADVYSLGCTMFELLTGRTPFEGPAAMQLALHQVQLPPRPGDVAADVPPGLESICLRCLRKKPEQRYGSCQELAEALAQWLTRNPDDRSPLPRWAPGARRMAAAAGILAALVIAMLAITGWASWASPGRSNIPASIPTPPDENHPDQPRTAAMAAAATPPPEPAAKLPEAPRPVEPVLHPAEPAVAPAAPPMPAKQEAGLAPKPEPMPAEAKAVPLPPAQPPPGPLPPSPPGVNAAGDPPPEKPRRLPPEPPVWPFTEQQARAYQNAWADHLGVPVAMSLDLGGGEKLTLRLVPPGTFWMGTPKTEQDDVMRRVPGLFPGWVAKERQHRVTLTKPLYLGEYEVTVSQFRRFAHVSGYETEAEKNNKGAVGWNRTTLEKRREFNWQHPGFAQKDDHPVTCVTWNDAERFCAWASATTVRAVRLPTEAEWEWGCRAGTASRYAFGDSEDEVGAFGNTAERLSKITSVSKKAKQGLTAPVGSYQPNWFGLCDMHGNVNEWCSDWYGEFDPEPLVDPTGPQTGAAKVQRGGSWSVLPGYCRSGFRWFAQPNFAVANSGFRVAVGLAPGPR